MAVIRPGKAGDLSYLPQIEALAADRLLDIGMGELHALFAGYVTSAEDFRAYMQAGRLWVAEEDARPVGFITVSIIGDHAHIDEVDVLPDYGRRGFGKALIDTVCQWTAAQGLSSVTLSTQANVPWNAPYYAKLGFEIMPPDQWTAPYLALRQHEADLGFPLDDRVLMIRRL